MSTEVIESESTNSLSASNGMSPIIERVLNSDVPAEKLDHLLNIQERYESNEARKAFNAALSKFKSESPTIEKNHHVQYSTKTGQTNYKHVTLGYALGQITPVLSKFGLSLTWRTHQDQAMITVTARLSHAKGHFEETSLSSLPDTSGGKNTIQAVGSVVTYLKRYTAFALLGLESIDDDDGMMTKSEFESSEPTQSKNMTDLLNAIQGAYNNGKIDEVKRMWSNTPHLDKAQLWSIFTPEWKEALTQINVTYREAS